MRIFHTKVILYFCQSQNVIREKLPKTFSNEKGERKMLMKLTPVHTTSFFHVVTFVMNIKWQIPNKTNVLNLNYFLNFLIAHFLILSQILAHFLNFLILLAHFLILSHLLAHFHTNIVFSS